jgi:hypothetical protein
MADDRLCVLRPAPGHRRRTDVVEEALRLRADSLIRVAVLEAEVALRSQLVDVEREQNALMVAAYREALDTPRVNAARRALFEQVSIEHARNITGFIEGAETHAQEPTSATNAPGLHMSAGPIFQSQHGGAGWTQVGPASPGWSEPTTPPRRGNGSVLDRQRRRSYTVSRRERIPRHRRLRRRQVVSRQTSSKIPRIIRPQRAGFWRFWRRQNGRKSTRGQRHVRIAGSH